MPDLYRIRRKMPEIPTPYRRAINDRPLRYQFSIAPALLIDTTSHTAELMLLSAFVNWLLLVYRILDSRKKKKPLG